MSGFAAVFQLDGAPVDRSWLRTMANFLAFRGPDGQEVWISGNAGMCHTLLRTSAETDGRAQIANLDNRLWIAGDVRIDDRETLIAKLSRGPCDLRTACSAALILHAYEAWGEACVEKLLGDFSFVIWDARRGRVFAARDHLGVRPLFYAQARQCLLISNTLDCIRQIPIVSDELNDRAIGDLLLAGKNLHPAETYFAAIQRLPVAHRLVAGPDGVGTERYWTLPIDELLYYKRNGDYVERFRELLRAAVRDRLPDGPLGVCMSGGLDSPALAATAVRLGATVSAFTAVWDRLTPDQERHYSGLVAEHLGIRIFYNVQDDEPWGWEPGSPPIHTPEPTQNPLAAESLRRCYCEFSAHARVFFWGDGPDASLLYEWRAHLLYLIRRGRWGRLCRDLALHVKAFKRVPLLSTLPRVGKEVWKRKITEQSDWYPAFPKWINEEFERRVGLRQRWEELQKENPSPHPVRKSGYASFARDFPMDWDTGNGGCPGDPAIDYLHPFWDIRIVRFLLAVPAVPWCREKFLIRTSLRGLLPESVRQRPKSPVPGTPYLTRVRQMAKPSLPDSRTLAGYVNMEELPEWPGESREVTDSMLRVLSLHYWLLAT
jgi:asparagine synthase (glutamine-hydrolysing)